MPLWLNPDHQRNKINVLFWSVLLPLFSYPISPRCRTALTEGAAPPHPSSLVDKSTMSVTSCLQHALRVLATYGASTFGREALCAPGGVRVRRVNDVGTPTAPPRRDGRGEGGHAYRVHRPHSTGHVSSPPIPRERDRRTRRLDS